MAEVGQQVWGQGIPQAEDDDDCDQPREEEQETEHAHAGAGVGDEQDKHRNSQQEGHQEVPPQHPDVDA